MGQHKLKKLRDGIFCTADERKQVGDEKPKKMTKGEVNRMVYRMIQDKIGFPYQIEESYLNEKY